MKNGFRMAPLLVLPVFVMALMVPSLSAHAHKVVASAYAGGSIVEGEIGFSNGKMAANIQVGVYDDNGNRLGETKTDEDGFFTFSPTRPVTHIFRANLGAGHVAEAILKPDELPDTAIATPFAAPSERSAPAGPVISKAVEPTAGQPGRQTEADLDRQRTLIAEAVRGELRPLRREIAAYKEKNDFQTILGGLGYIVGIFGLWFFVAARRQKKGA